MKPGPAAGRRFYFEVENLREFLSPCGPWPIVDNNSLKKQSSRTSTEEPQKAQKEAEKKRSKAKRKKATTQKMGRTSFFGKLSLNKNRQP